MTDLSQLSPGDPHYRAYVGPPLEYDLMGASQFRLLTTLGLRDHHKVLDLGCGSLRAGRLLIPYLARGRYFGIEPNPWLIADAVENELGSGILETKAPRFAHNDDFDCGVFGESFDFILAQSIFSHTAADLFVLGLKSALASLAPDGLLLATYVPEGRGPPAEGLTGWTYPTVCAYAEAQACEIFSAAGAFARVIPWKHPRQRWFAAAREPGRLPAEALDADLTGVTFGVAGYS